MARPCADRLVVLDMFVRGRPDTRRSAGRSIGHRNSGKRRRGVVVVVVAVRNPDPEPPRVDRRHDALLRSGRVVVVSKEAPVDPVQPVRSGQPKEPEGVVVVVVVVQDSQNHRTTNLVSVAGDHSPVHNVHSHAIMDGIVIKQQQQQEPQGLQDSVAGISQGTVAQTRILVAHSNARSHPNGNPVLLQQL
jgi:hypothetical protein